MRIYKLFIIVAISLFLAACGGQKVVPQNTAEKFFQEGENYFEKSLFDDAIASWEKVRDTYYSPELNMLAELKIAEAYYRSERYAEAASAFTDFLQQHPNDKRVARVLYRLGLSHYQQILSADRDQTNTDNALTVFTELLRRFPNDPQAGEAKLLMQRCLNRLAEHEVYVGNFYLKYDNPPAAITRLEKALENYPNYAYKDEAFYYLAKAYVEVGEKDKARDVLQKLLEQYPGSDFLEDAQELLQEIS